MRLLKSNNNLVNFEQIILPIKEHIYKLTAVIVPLIAELFLAV